MGGPAPTALHAQLCALVEFLELDSRPTAIFLSPQGHQDLPAHNRSLYENGSFAKLEFNEDFMNALLESLRASAAGDSPGRQAKAAGLRDWQLRPLGVQFEALVLVGTGHVGCSPTPDSAPPTAEGTSETETKTADTPLTDWTQYDVPGLSPWIRHVRAIDWSKTELGPICYWSSTLRGHMLSMMANPNPRLMTWGPRMTFVYNEACSPIWGAKHPECLAKPMWEPWADIWDGIGPILEAAYRGEVMQQYNLPLPSFDRNGYPEEIYFNYTMLPIYGPEGKIEGIIDELQETTATVRWDRRKESLVNFGKSLAKAHDLDALWSSSLQGLESAVIDVGFSLLYAVAEEPDRPESASTMSSGSESRYTQRCILQGSVGLPADSPTIPQNFVLQEALLSSSGIIKACAEACKNRVPVALNSRDNSLPEVLRVGVPGRAFGDVIQRAVVTPIVSISGNQILAVMVTGINPRCVFDTEYSLYFDYLGDLLTKAASRISLPQEQKRAQETYNDVNTALSAELHLMTMQAERSEAKFERMSAEAPTGMFIYGGDGRPLYVNDEYLRIVGETRERHFQVTKSATVSSELVHEEDVERFQAAYRRVMEQKLPVTIEYRLKKPWASVDKATGHEMVGERWLLANAFPDLNYDGKLQSVQGWVTDISHRRFTEKLVSRKLEEALESKRLTENFIDMTSHEMRNPLSAMLQSADSIVMQIQTANALPSKKTCFGQSCTLDNEAAADILDAAQTIVLCAQHQRRIVDDILTLSKLDASLVEMCPEKVILPTLLDKSLRMFEAEIARVDTRTEIIVESSYTKLEVESVMLDASRLLQIIINLLGNSIKFIQNSQTREITISLGASYEKPTGQHHGVCFVPRANEEPARSPVAGWGDGEDIYVQLAVTDTGRGLSEDELKLLFHRFSQGSPKTYKQYGGSGLGLYICRQLCELQGGQIGATCANGKTTFSFYVRAKRWQAGQNGPDDLTESSTRATMRRPFTKPTRPVLIGGTNGPTTSPARLEHRQSVEDTRLPRNQDQDTSQTSSIIDDREMVVLLVEDNKINQRITSQQLRKLGGHIVHVADHGQECLDFLEQSTFCLEDAELSLILLDLEMPIMDGWTCAREIRQRQRDGKVVRHVPIIAVTANARPEQIASAMDAGADAVVTKPFRTSDLLPRMREVMAEVAQREEDG